MKWTDDDLVPVAREARHPVQDLIAELQTQPGRWAEIARYSSERGAAARSRGSQTRKRYPEIDYAVRREGDEYVLYFRAKP